MIVLGLNTTLISMCMQVLEDWRYISMVIDRLQLYMFLAVTMVGTASILVGAPHIFDSIDQDDITKQILASNDGVGYSTDPW